MRDSREAASSFDSRIDAELLDFYLNEPVQPGELPSEAEDREFAIQRLVTALIKRGIDPPLEAVGRAIAAMPQHPIPMPLRAYAKDHFQGKKRSRRPQSRRSPFLDIGVLAQYHALIDAGHNRTSALQQTAHDNAISDATVEKILTEARRRHPHKETP